MKKLFLVSLVLVLSACSSSNNSDTQGMFTETPAAPETPTAPTPPEPPVSNAIFEIETVNLTVGQPFSPLAVFVHNSDQAMFAIGTAASEGVEVMAESGDNSQLLAEMDSVAELSAAGPLGPGATETLTLELDTDDISGLRFSLATMLVNTNDAITAVNAADIAELEVDQYRVFNTISYDSGTEANTETLATIPGPAAGGEGFNTARDDVRDELMMHAGVVSADDGLSTSELGQQHRWDNPVARVRITRTQ